MGWKGGGGWPTGVPRRRAGGEYGVRPPLHPNTVGEANLRLLASQAQARKGASSPGAGTDAAVADKSAPPQRRDGTAQYPHEGDVKLTTWVHRMCAHKLPVFKCTLMDVANAHIKGTKWESNWPYGVTENW